MSSMKKKKRPSLRERMRRDEEKFAEIAFQLYPNDYIGQCAHFSKLWTAQYGYMPTPSQGKKKIISKKTPEQRLEATYTTRAQRTAATIRSMNGQAGKAAASAAGAGNAAHQQDAAEPREPDKGAKA